MRREGSQFDAEVSLSNLSCCWETLCFGEIVKWVCVYFFLCVAAVCWKAGEPLVMEEGMVAPPLAGEVRIRIICTSLCYSDITFWKLKVRFTFTL